MTRSRRHRPSRPRVSILGSVLVLILGGAGAPGACGQSEEPTTTPTAAKPDEAVRRLQKDFDNLFTSLRNSGGVREDSLNVIRKFRDRVDAMLQTRPDDPHLLALATQLSVWLKEDDRVHEGYRRLLEATNEDVQYAEGWIGYFQDQANDDRVTEIYQLLLQRNPGEPRFRLEWAELLKQRGQFDGALEVLEATEYDPAEEPQAAVTQAECYLATHQFQKAVDTLALIDEQTLATPILRRDIPRLKTTARDYVEKWAAEQELRSTEAAVDDLPRVIVVTDRGTITLELFENEAPNTVANFISLAESRFYDQTKIHRVDPAGAYVEGGDPLTRTGSGTPGTSNPGYTIADELENARQHFSGSIGLAKSVKPNSGGCLFYITTRPLPERNGRFTVFGRVLDGLDVVKELEKDDTIQTVEVLRKRDHEYEPEKLPLTGTPTPVTTPSADLQPFTPPASEPQPDAPPSTTDSSS